MKHLHWLVLIALVGNVGCAGHVWLAPPVTPKRTERAAARPPKDASSPQVASRESSRRQQPQHRTISDQPPRVATAHESSFGYPTAPTAALPRAQQVDPRAKYSLHDQPDPTADHSSRRTHPPHVTAPNPVAPTYFTDLNGRGVVPASHTQPQQQEITYVDPAIGRQVGPPQLLNANANVADEVVPATQDTTVNDRPADERATESEEVPNPESEDNAQVVEEEPMDWREEVEDAIFALKQELGRGDYSEEEEIRLETSLRLLSVVANHREQAVTEIRQLDDNDREFWQYQMMGLLVAFDPDSQHAPSRRAAIALRDFRKATARLASVSTLDIRTLAFCDAVQSYGRFTPFKSSRFEPGQEVLLYVEIDNFAAQQQGDQFQTDLQGEYEILDDQGGRVTHAVLNLQPETSRNRLRDYFIAYPLRMPSDIGSGEYVLRLTMEDKIGKKSNQATIEFRVK